MAKLNKIALVRCKESDVVPHKTGLLRRFYNLARTLKPHYLLITTFHLDMLFVDEEVLSQIPSSCKSLILFAPFSRNKNIARARGRSNVRFIKARTRVFHPKFIIAVAGPHTIIGIGSGNLTTGGWGGQNQEIYHFYADQKLREKHSEFRKLYPFSIHMQQACIDYLNKLSTYEIHHKQSQDSEIMASVMEHLQRMNCHGIVSSNDSGVMVHNYDRSFYEYIKKRFNNNIKEVHIFSPIHFSTHASDNDDNADMADAVVTYPLFDHFIRLFHRSKHPVIKFYSSDAVPKILSRKLQSKGVTFHANKCQQFSHLKAIVIKTAKKIYMLSGSANFTVPALFERRSHSKNSELMHFMDITDQWPQLIEKLIGTKRLLPGEEVDIAINHQNNQNNLSAIIDQVEVIKFKDNSGHDVYRCEVYTSLINQQKRSLSLGYENQIEDDELSEISKKDKNKRLIKVNLHAGLNTIMIKKKSSWFTLVQDQPQFCSYTMDSHKYFFPVNYNYNNYADELFTDDEKRYSELLEYFGCSIRKRVTGLNRTETIVETQRANKADYDDKETDNQYQSLTDQFYHEWKHIYRKLKEYKKKKDMYRYDSGIEEIRRYLSSADVKRLTPVQIQFVQEFVLEKI